jgi:NodT family efflux transporter outer membrane factor (OMF) lipoprotein
VLLLVSASLAAVSGCTSLAGPKYVSPNSPLKQAWSLNAADPASAATDIPVDWWTGFGDLYLDDLIKRALLDSQDIKILAARLEAADIGIDQERSNNIPKINLNIETDTLHSSKETLHSYQAVSELSWELDIWGNVRKGIRAQQAEFYASEADYRAGYLRLAADVATTYIGIRALDDLIDIQNQALVKNQRILDIYQRQLREGLVPRSNVLQQHAETQGIKRELIDLERQRATSVNRLTSLLGQPAGSLQVPHAGLRQTLRTPLVPVGLPADLLARRPDILAAEYRVLKAYNLVGQARLERLPSIGLSGRGGLASTALSALVNGWTLGLGLALKMPIFDPSLSLNIKSRKVEHRISEEEYRKTVIQAFEEVENTLINLASYKQQAEELEQQLISLRIVNRQTMAQLSAGIISLLEVFESERTLLATEQLSLEFERQSLTDTVTLYKALGGGWPKQAVVLTDR